ncbi:MAG: tetratricopeptide repeat protein [Elusimicrobiales bacterium]
MKNSFGILLCAVVFCATSTYAASDKTLLSARESILSGSVSPRDVLLKYSEAVKKTNAAPVLGEYAYALAYAGLGEAALTSIDRALIAEPLHPEIRFYLSEIFNAAGLEAASEEISATAPSWLKGRQVKLPKLDVAAPAGDFEAASVSLNMLMAQRRYAQAAVQYDRLCKANQAEPRCHVGYALALERLGAYKAASAEASKNLALYKDPEPQAITRAFIDDLNKRPPLKLSSEDKPTLKGRYLLFTGGSLNRADDRTLYSFSTRVGKFLSERIDVSANAAINGGNAVSDYNGLTLGAVGRYNIPLSFLPLNLTLAAKGERVPAPEKNFTFLLSPGLSYFIKDSSVDLFFDLALNGPYSGSVTMSLGYTIYFGVGK